MHLVWLHWEKTLGSLCLLPSRLCPLCLFPLLKGDGQNKEYVHGFLQIPPVSFFPLVDPIMYISFRWEILAEYNYMLNVVSPTTESPNPGMLREREREGPCQWTDMGNTCTHSHTEFSFFFFFLRFDLFILERREGKEKERERNICARDTQIHCLSHAPNWGPGPQPRHVPWPGIKPVTFQFTGQHSIHWITPARAIVLFLCLI